MLKIKTNKKNYNKHIRYLMFLYFFSFLIGILSLSYLNNYKNTEYKKLINNQKNEYEKRLFSLEYFLHQKKNNETYLVNFKKSETYNINDEYNISKFTNNLLGNPKGAKAKSSGYFDIYNKEKIVFAGGDGVFGYFDIDNFSEDTFDMKLIRSNLKNLINYQEFFSKGDLGLKEITIDKDELYIAYNKEVKKNCFNLSILKAKINFSFLNFEEFFSYDECWIDTGFARNRSGGRIVIKDNKKILVSTGTYDDWNAPQDSESFFGKVLEIDKKTKEYKIISKGHRNPQGLYYNKYRDLIVSTDHGPKRGDEVNLDLNPGLKIKNFGWPISSYGDHYDNEKSMIKNIYELAPLNKSHKDFGFVEPIKYYDKNVAPSGITFVPENFSNIQESYFISGLGFRQADGAKALYVVGFNEDYSKVVKEKQISIGERIRDLEFIHSKNILVLFLETSSSFAILKKIK